MAVAVVLFAAGLSAQGKPNFTGKWTMQPDPNAAPPGGGGGGGGGGRGGRGGGFGGGGAFNCGMECTIAQDANALTVTTTGANGETKRVFKLDGSDSKIDMPGRGGAAGTTETAKAMWDGNNIVISMTRSIDRGGSPMSITSKTTIAMEGGNMTVQTATDAGQGAQPGGSRRIRRARFRRTQEAGSAEVLPAFLCTREAAKYRWPRAAM